MTQLHRYVHNAGDLALVVHDTHLQVMSQAGAVNLTPAGLRWLVTTVGPAALKLAEAIHAAPEENRWVRELPEPDYEAQAEARAERDRPAWDGRDDPHDPEVPR